MKLITMLCSLAVSTLLCAQTPQAQGPGTVTGSVLGEDGQPIANANVCILITVKPNNTMSMCNNVTDQAGHFEIQHVALGSFQLYATKEEDGYAGFNRFTDPQNKVVLTLQEPTANVTIKLGPKAGMLIGSVRDSVTGKPVDKIRVIWTGAIEENAASGSSSGYRGGEFRLNLPTNNDFIVIVTAPGYKPWVYNDHVEGLSLHLASGEQKSLDIELVPDPRATKDANSK